MSDLRGVLARHRGAVPGLYESPDREAEVPDGDDDETVTPHFNEDFESECYGEDEDD